MARRHGPGIQDGALMTLIFLGKSNMLLDRD
jgi:hypothetical protein